MGRCYNLNSSMKKRGNNFWEYFIKKRINKEIKVAFDYERGKYINYSQQTTNIIFINIGIFARLMPDISVGEICVPNLSLDISYSIVTRARGIQGATM